MSNSIGPSINEGRLLSGAILQEQSRVARKENRRLATISFLWRALGVLAIFSALVLLSRHPDLLLPLYQSFTEDEIVVLSTEEFEDKMGKALEKAAAQPLLPNF